MNAVIEKLKTVNAYEKKLKSITTRNTKNIGVGFDFENNQIKIKINGINLSKKIDRPIIHQIGSRIWRNNDYSQIYSNWESAYSQPNEFSNLIEKTLQSNNLRIKYSQKGHIYGILAPNFYEVNPIDFREVFIKDLTKLVPIQCIDNSANINRFGEVEEVFDLQWEKSKVKLNSPVKISLGIIYGLNNGYSSFRLNLIREILICKNGLTNEEKNNIRWKHTKDIALEEFSKKSLNHIYLHHKELTNLINHSKERELNSESEQEFFERLHIVKAGKDRVRERLKVEIKNEGQNEWALSQALTNIGTHFYKGRRNKYHRETLITTGTQILENNLSTLLKKEPVLVNTIFGKSYGTMLPINFLKNKTR
jgi:hypothetical protein